jgi:RNA polymerase sigma-70 factor (ECF subfamily)
MSDNGQLLQKLQDRDPTAIREMVDDFAPQIYRLAFGILQDTMEAQDITQDVFISVLRRIDDFEGRASIPTWIYRITVNASLDRIRLRQRRKETISIEDFMPSFTADGKHAEEIADWSEAPLDHLLNREARDKIQEAIDSLPDELRIVLVMKDIEGFHLKEMCEILDLSLPAVKSRLHRARLVLRGILSTYFDKNLRYKER